MRYSQQARRDILDIWLQIAASRPVSADPVLDRIQARCGQLNDFPNMGPPRPEIFAAARVIVIDPWLAIYRLDDAGAQVVRVVDASRDLTKLKFPRE